MQRLPTVAAKSVVGEAWQPLSVFIFYPSSTFSMHTRQIVRFEPSVHSIRKEMFLCSLKLEDISYVP